MNLTKIAASDCKDGDCPAVYRTDRGTIGVQGYLLDRAAPEGESGSARPTSGSQASKSP